MGSIPACAGEPRLRTGRGRLRTVYPRVCGGTHLYQRHVRPRQGLSPRVRGNLLVHLLSGYGARSIPACAGEPPSGANALDPRWVYPRVCGGTAHAAHKHEAAPGLSPRVRGNLRAVGGRRRALRSIPACAGEPRSSFQAAGGSRVYPRVCGGTIDSAMLSMCASGLSPRVRGNRRDVAVIPVQHRSIPACAGEPLAAVMPPSPPINPNYT